MTPLSLVSSSSPLATSGNLFHHNRHTSPLAAMSGNFTSRMGVQDEEFSDASHPHTLALWSGATQDYVKGIEGLFFFIIFFFCKVNM